MSETIDRLLKAEAAREQMLVIDKIVTLAEKELTKEATGCFLQERLIKLFMEKETGRGDGSITERFLDVYKKRILKSLRKESSDE